MTSEGSKYALAAMLRGVADGLESNNYQHRSGTLSVEWSTDGTHQVCITSDIVLVRKGILNVDSNQT
jgi:hypothetical protein